MTSFWQIGSVLLTGNHEFPREVPFLNLTKVFDGLIVAQIVITSEGLEKACRRQPVHDGTFDFGQMQTYIKLIEGFINLFKGFQCREVDFIHCSAH